MHKVLVLFVVVATVSLGMFVPRGPAAPALPDKPVKYEYAELRYSSGFDSGPKGMVAKMGGGPGGGVGAGPAPIGAGGGPPAAVQTTVRWTTAEEEMSFKEWEELADKLGAAPPKKESPPTVHKLRVLNKLSAMGWEVLDRPSTDSSIAVWTFRRQVP